MGDAHEPNEHLSAATRTLERALRKVSDRLDAVNDATDTALDRVSSMLSRPAPWVAMLADDLSWAVSEAIDTATQAVSEAVMWELVRIQRASGGPVTMWLPYRMSWLSGRRLLTEIGAAFVEFGHRLGYQTLAGSKNVNYPLRLVDGMALLRQRRFIDDDDATMFREHEIAELIEATGARGMRLLCSFPDLWLAVYTFVDGIDLGSTHPFGAAMPAHVIDDDIAYQAALCAIPESSVARLTGGDRRPRSMRDYYWWFDDAITGIRASKQQVYGRLYGDLHVPLDPWQRRDGGSWQPRGDRRLSVIHGDLHRFNRRIKDGTTYYVDPELALWADPLREVTQNLFLTRHDDDEKRRYLDGWEAGLPSECTQGWREDFDASMGRSEIVSAVQAPARWASRWPGADDAAKPELAAELARQLNIAHAYWEPDVTITTEDAWSALDRWVDSRGRR